MIRELNIDQGIIDGDSKRFIESYISSEVITFRQRKSYDEYYWDIHSKVDLDSLLIDKLSEYFSHVLIDSVEILITE